MKNRKDSIRMVILSLPMALLFFFPLQAWSQDFPTKPITIYCGFEAGATTDVSIRGLATQLEKILGVSVVVENKVGGAASVAAALIATKPPDGYMLSVLDTILLTARPHLIPVAFDPLKDFTFLGQYGETNAGICVLSDSPFKTIDDFIKYAKEHPGRLSYGSAGTYSRGHIGMEIFAQCKGLTFKHVPFTGGAPANTALLGKHVDFVAGVGQHLQYVRQGIFRMLMVYSSEIRDPNYPNIPMAQDLGCQDIPPQGLYLGGPKGIPEAIQKKLGDAFKRAADMPEFKKVLENQYILYRFKDGRQLEKDLPSYNELFKTMLQKIGAKKAGS